jgi:hypothetical protein
VLSSSKSTFTSHPWMAPMCIAIFDRLAFNRSG